jgi:2-phospho-L-lactate guanylyltransferase
VVLPVKLLRSAKTRLAPLDPPAREALALAMTLDTVAAALACAAVGAVYVVTDDGAAAMVGAVGAVVVPDTPNAGLNRALEHGAAEARRHRPGDGVVALTADVPALKPAELSLVLGAAALHPRTVIADASGDGTVALTAGPGLDLHPAFGPHSLERHVRAGAVALDSDTPGLRRDVDTIDDLRHALDLGCGPHTTNAAAVLLGKVAPRQATVRDFDDSTHSGTLLMDDGTALAFDGTAFDTSGLRLLRAGQRVRVALALDPVAHVLRVTAVTLASFPLPQE